MSSGRQLLSLAGQAIGAYFGGPIGAAIGGVIGGEVGGVIDGPPEGPRLSDLSAPQIEYGGKIGRFYGGPKWFEVSPLWMSEKREDSETVGGKGGDSGVEQFSYRCDMLLRVCESREGTPCQALAVTGIEIDGQLKWTALADASSESLAASAEVEDWANMTVLTGSETQAPWSVMEAVVGTPNAIAYRGYLTVGFEDMLLSPNGMPRRVRIQAITAGSPVEGDVFWLLNFDGSTGSTSTVDTSSWNHTVTMTASEQDTPSAFGATGGWNNSTSQCNIGSTINVPWTLDEGLTLEGRVQANEILQNGAFHFGVITLNAAAGQIGARVNNIFSPDVSRLELLVMGEIAGTDFLVPPEYPIPTGGMFHWAVDWNPDTLTATLYINGTNVLEHTYGGVLAPVTAITNAGTLDSTGPLSGTNVFGVDGVRFTRRYRRYTSGFTPPNVAPTDDLGVIWEPGPVNLRQILEYEAERCAPLAAGSIDFSAADGLEVDCHVVIGSAADAIQPLLTRFWFDLFSSDRLYLVRRGGSVEQTIPFRFTGANSEGFAGLIRDNDVEISKKKAVTYFNLMADGETDTRTGDRESPGSDVDTLAMNLHMVQSEAQGLADTATADARIAGHTATIQVGARNGLLLQPGSVFNGVDHHGNTYRMLARRIVWDRWAWNVDVRLDDASVLQAAGIAVDVDTRSLTVPPPPEAILYVLDIPLLRQQDDGPGEYVAVTQTGRFRGVAILKSSDGVTYTRVTDVAQRGTAGVCDSELPAFSGWGWDNSSVLTVTLDDGSGGTLSSATKSAIESSRSLNLAAVGVHGRWELIQFATATLLTGSTYELRGFLRNLFGTEWTSSDHEAEDSFVMLQANGMARIPGSVADLGQTRYYKAVPSGRSAGNVTAHSIVCEEQGLLPYSPTDVWNDAGTIRWNRRSRIEGAVGLDPPLGESSERYDAELYDGVTLEDSASGLTTPEWTPVDPSGLTVRVYQLSELVGRGHVAEKEMT